MPQSHQPSLPAQHQHLLKQPTQGSQVSFAEQADGPEIRLLDLHSAHRPGNIS
jgi:hypothetical protein